MTREEAIKFAQCASQLSQKPEVREFFRMCEKSLRAQQTPAQLDRRRWEGCELSSGREGHVVHIGIVGCRFCPACGRPLTEEAWAELERRIGGNDGTIDK